MSAKQKGIYSANSTEQSQHRVTHYPTRVKWAVCRNTQYKGLSRHQKNCNYIWNQLSIFKMPFYGFILQKSGVPAVMTVQSRHTCFLALALTVFLLTEELKSFWKPGLRTPSEHTHFACVSAVPHQQHKKMTQGQHQLQLQMILALCVCVQDTDTHRYLCIYVTRVFRASDFYILGSLGTVLVQ